VEILRHHVLRGDLFLTSLHSALPDGKPLGSALVFSLREKEDGLLNDPVRGCDFFVDSSVVHLPSLGFAAVAAWFERYRFKRSVSHYRKFVNRRRGAQKPIF